MYAGDNNGTHGSTLQQTTGLEFDENDAHLVLV